MIRVATRTRNVLKLDIFKLLNALVMTAGHVEDLREFIRFSDIVPCINDGETNTMKRDPVLPHVLPDKPHHGCAVMDHPISN